MHRLQVQILRLVQKKRAQYIQVRKVAAVEKYKKIESVTP